MNKHWCTTWFIYSLNSVELNSVSYDQRDLGTDKFIWKCISSFCREGGDGFLWESWELRTRSSFRNWSIIVSFFPTSKLKVQRYKFASLSFKWLQLPTLKYMYIKHLILLFPIKIKWLAVIYFGVVFNCKKPPNINFTILIISNYIV